MGGNILAAKVLLQAMKRVDQIPDRYWDKVPYFKEKEQQEQQHGNKGSHDRRCRDENGSRPRSHRDARHTHADGRRRSVSEDPKHHQRHHRDRIADLRGHAVPARPQSASPFGPQNDDGGRGFYPPRRRPRDRAYSPAQQHSTGATPSPAGGTPAYSPAGSPVSSPTFRPPQASHTWAHTQFASGPGSGPASRAQTPNLPPYARPLEPSPPPKPPMGQYAHMQSPPQGSEVPGSWNGAAAATPPPAAAAPSSRAAQRYTPAGVTPGQATYTGG